jgi:hypothetical protein
MIVKTEYKFATKVEGVAVFARETPVPEQLIDPVKRPRRLDRILSLGIEALGTEKSIDTRVLLPSQFCLVSSTVQHA